MAGQSIGGPATDTSASAPQRQHVVAAGETLGAIASQYDMHIAAILTANPGLDKDKLQIGDTLAIPATDLSQTQLDAYAKKNNQTPPKQKVLAATKVSTGGSGFSWPLAKRGISQYFGENGHTGVDVPTSPGSTVYAVADGCTIHVGTGWDGGYGNLEIEQVDSSVAKNLFIYYAHLDDPYTPAGSCYSKGDPIAKSGDTGNSTGPHLHLEFRMNGTPVNPLKYVRP